MSLVYPDNDNRSLRVAQLGTTAQNDLLTCQRDFKSFNDKLKVVNETIADAYKKAGLKEPSITSIDILKSEEVDGHENFVQVSKIIADIGGFFGTLKYLVPGAIKVLEATGFLEEETVEKVLFNISIPLMEEGLSVTVGKVTGLVVGGIVGGIFIAGMDLGISAIEGSIAKGKLQEGIKQLFPMRATIKLSLEKVDKLLDSLNAVKTTLDVLIKNKIPLTDELLQQIIHDSVQPALNEAELITPTVIAKELNAIDIQEKAWMNDDPSTVTWKNEDPSTVTWKNEDPSTVTWKNEDSNSDTWINEY